MPLPEDVMVDPLLRPLNHGEVGVSFYPGGKREILQESELQLVDRMYQPGDLLKKSIDDPRAGIVTRYVLSCGLPLREHVHTSITVSKLKVALNTRSAEKKSRDGKARMM